MANVKVDVLVVGAGPAGASAACFACEKGANVMMIDARRTIGSDPHCAEYVPRMLALEMDIPDRAVVQKVETMETRLPGRIVETRAPGFVMDRYRFDHGLAEKAAVKGCRVLSGAKLAGIEEDGVFIVKTPAGNENVQAGAVIAADGAGSSTRRMAGLPSFNMLTGVQVEVPLVESLNRTIILFRPEFRHGYAWLFPKGNMCNLGLGMAEAAAGEAWRLLEWLRGGLVEAAVVKDGVLRRSIGAIPVNGPDKTFYSGRILFCGDAAGLTHPITGAGIPQAVLSGDLAGEFAVEGLSSDWEKAAGGYREEIMGRFGRTLDWAAGKRRLLERCWETMDFETLVMKTWPAFPEYRQA